MILTNTQDFALERGFLEMKYSALQIRQHALFLKSELKKENIVPCDENGNILKEPEFDFKFLRGSAEDNELKIYQKALEKVWFKGFENHKIEDFKKYLKITNNELRTNGVFSRVEHLVNNVVVYPIELTEAGIKQFM